jgi:hypothetical protein
MQHEHTNDLIDLIATHKAMMTTHETPSMRPTTMTPDALRIWRCDLDRPDTVREVLRVLASVWLRSRPLPTSRRRREEAQPRPPLTSKRRR